MNKDIAILIVNYNMPERTDALCEHIKEYVEWPYGLFVIDNGSDLMDQSRFTNIEIRENIQTTRGWMDALKAVNGLHNCFAYWFLITSAEFTEPEDPLTPLAQFLIDNPEAVGIHPALTEDSTSDWPHLFDRGSGVPRQTWHIDNIASLYRADWFDQVNGFDERMTYAWGIDLDLSWKARYHRRGLWIHEGTRIKKVTDIGYEMGRMNESADSRRRNASQEMMKVLTDEYGPLAWARMLGENITDEMIMLGEFRELERATCPL